MIPPRSVTKGRMIEVVNTAFELFSAVQLSSRYSNIIRNGITDRIVLYSLLSQRGAFDSAKKHKRQSVTAKREKAQTPKFV